MAGSPVMRGKTVLQGETKFRGGRQFVRKPTLEWTACLTGSHLAQFREGNLVYKGKPILDGDEKLCSKGKVQFIEGSPV